MDDSCVNSEVKQEYLLAIMRSLKQQLPCFVICLLLLDAGRTLRLCLIAMLGYWLFTMVCLARGHRMPDRTGLWFVNWGFVPLFFVICLGNSWIRGGMIR